MSPEKESQNCWEFMDCPKEIKEDCAVYKIDSGKECWFLVDLKKGCPASEEYCSCFECSWYKKNNPES